MMARFFHFHINHSCGGTQTAVILLLAGSLIGFSATYVGGTVNETVVPPPSVLSN